MCVGGMAFRFTCLQCGRCCSSHGEGKVILLYEDDVERLANNLRVDIVDFVTCSTAVYKYTFVFLDESQTIRRLGLRAGRTCPFLRGSSCAVHEFKPFRCWAGPLVNPLISLPEQLETYTSYCRGFGRGEWVPISLVRKRLRQQYDREVDYFAKVHDKNGRMHSWIYGRPYEDEFRIFLDYTKDALDKLLWGDVLEAVETERILQDDNRDSNP